MTNSGVNRFLATLISQVKNGKSLSVLRGDGELYEASFVFNKPALRENIQMLEKKHAIKLPQDIVEFLMISNGASLFDTGDGESLIVYSISEMDEEADFYTPDIAPGLFPLIKYAGGTIFFDPQKDNRNLFLSSSGSEFDYMGLKFEELLEYFIRSNGNYFWEWIPLLACRNLDEEEVSLKDWLEL
ncbi:SMI1/KNR4 family protein [Paenibacillus silvae]|uniref:SMI1/KNR4 family protein n=1 Tax=Paenibacillus silvae TaxID=1325358 RepID=UPI0025A2966D|nr:SMI1/KNR4 family protein [Paenibacillus silvae]MDM5277179.1 SMI1/KNR4 family protein [Paenibacillus silvae]